MQQRSFDFPLLVTMLVMWLVLSFGWSSLVTVALFLLIGVVSLFPLFHTLTKATAKSSTRQLTRSERSGRRLSLRLRFRQLRPFTQVMVVYGILAVGSAIVFIVSGSKVHR